MRTEQTEKGIFIPNEDAANDISNELSCPKCSRTFKNQTALRMHTIRKHTGRNWDSSKNFKRKKRGVPWTPSQHARFRKTMKQKALARMGNNKKAERIQIVYPDPREEQDKVEVIPYLKFCPNCGEHLEGWRHLWKK